MAPTQTSQVGAAIKPFNILSKNVSFEKIFHFIKIIFVLNVKQQCGNKKNSVP